MLKKMSFVFCAGLFAAAIAGGCKKEEKGGAAAGGGDCAKIGAKTTSEGIAKIPKDVPAEAKKTFEDLSKKAGDLVTKLCKEDKWSAESIKCGLTAKDPSEECEKLLTADQNKHIQDEFGKMMGGAMAMPTGGDKPADGEGDKPADGEGDKPADGEGDKPADGEGDKPADGEGDKAAAGGAANSGIAECDAYIAAVEKFVACDKIPQASRDATKQGLDGMKAAWGDMGAMPEEAKKQTADTCKQAADAMVQGAKAMGCEM